MSVKLTTTDLNIGIMCAVFNLGVIYLATIQVAPLDTAAMKFLAVSNFIMAIATFHFIGVTALIFCIYGRATDEIVFFSHENIYLNGAIVQFSYAIAHLFAIYAAYTSGLAISELFPVAELFAIVCLVIAGIVYIFV